MGPPDTIHAHCRYLPIDLAAAVWVIAGTYSRNRHRCPAQHPRGVHHRKTPVTRNLDMLGTPLFTTAIRTRSSQLGMTVFQPTNPPRRNIRISRICVVTLTERQTVLAFTAMESPREHGPVRALRHRLTVAATRRIHRTHRTPQPLRNLRYGQRLIQQHRNIVRRPPQLTSLRTLHSPSRIHRPRRPHRPHSPAQLLRDLLDRNRAVQRHRQLVIRPATTHKPQPNGQNTRLFPSCRNTKPRGPGAALLSVHAVKSAPTAHVTPLYSIFCPADKTGSPKSRQ